MTKQSYTYAHVECALALWEAVIATEGEHEIDSKKPAPPWRAWREQHGTQALRSLIISWAVDCSDDWFNWDGCNLGLIQQQYPAFDWDYCPEWLERCVVWDGCHLPAMLAAGLRRVVMHSSWPAKSDNLTQSIWDGHSATLQNEQHTGRKALHAPKPVVFDDVQVFEPKAPIGVPVCPVCPVCGSDDVVAEAGVVWSGATGQWVADDVTDYSGQCNTCLNKDLWLTMKPVGIHDVLVVHHYQVRVYKTVEVLAPNVRCAERYVTDGTVIVQSPAVEMLDPGDGWSVQWSEQIAADALDA